MCEKYIQLFFATFIFVHVNFVLGAENNEDLIFSIVKKGEEMPEVLWPLGVIPYYLDHNSYDYIVSRHVRTVMNNLEDMSCITFKAIMEPAYDGPWVHITNPEKVRECVHTDFSNKSSLEINLVLGYECLQSWEIMHSLMHAIGFKDEVTHPQRDQYIRIMWENIHPRYQPLFGIRYDDFLPVTTEYDPMSIMHFHDRAFTKNGQATIAPLIPGLMINPSGDLSPLDKMRLRLIFGHECNKRKVGDLLDSCKTALHSTQNKKRGVDGVEENNKSDEEKNVERDNGSKDDKPQGTNNDDKPQGTNNDDPKDGTATDDAQDLDDEGTKDNPQGIDDDPQENDKGSKDDNPQNNAGTKDDDPQGIDNDKGSGNNNEGGANDGADDISLDRLKQK